MKKLIITRIIALFAFVFTAVAVAAVLYASGFYSLEDSIWNKVIDIYYSSGIIAVCIFYFFAGKRFHGVSIKKLTLVFFIWSLICWILSFFVNQYLIFLSGGHNFFGGYAYRLRISANPHITPVIGFLVEMVVIIMGIFIGRIKAGKTDGKYVIFLSKFCGIIIAFITACMVRGIFVVASPRAPLGYLSKEGVRLGWIISMLPVALWYIYAGFKSFRLNLKIILPIFLLWDILGIVLWRVFKAWKLLEINGGYFAFHEGLSYITKDRYLFLVCISAYLLEALFITAGVFLGRYFNKKKVITKETSCEIVTE